MVSRPDSRQCFQHLGRVWPSGRDPHNKNLDRISSLRPKSTQTLPVEENFNHESPEVHVTEIDAMDGGRSSNILDPEDLGKAEARFQPHYFGPERASG